MTIWPQITWIVLVALGVGVRLMNHGKQETVNVWMSLIAISISLTLLYHGGFFAPLGWQP